MASKLDPHEDEIRRLVEVEEWSQARVAKHFEVGKTTVTDFLRNKNIKSPGVASNQHGPSMKAKVTGHYDPNEQISREEMLAAENKELKAALGKVRKGSVQSARVVQSVEDALREATIEPSVPVVAPEPDGEAHHRQLVILSDFHGGEVVDPEIVNGYIYNWAIMEQRVDEVIQSLLSHKKNSPALTGLDIIFGGDMCSGANHEEITVTNEYPLAVQAVKMGTLQAHIVERLVPHYANINVVTVEGNHPRFVSKPAAKEPENNADWIASVFSQAYLAKYDTVNWRVGRANVRHEIAGRTCYIWHGDGVRSSMPGVPEGGIARRVNTIQSMLNYKVDHWIHGHFHTAYMKQGGRIIGNGSLKGPDEWVQKNFGGGDPPTQLLLTFDERARRMTDARLITPQAGVPQGAEG